VQPIDALRPSIAAEALLESPAQPRLLRAFASVAQAYESGAARAA
jgi:hypothetical protein